MGYGQDAARGLHEFRGSERKEIKLTFAQVLCQTSHRSSASIGVSYLSPSHPNQATSKREPKRLVWRLRFLGRSSITDCNPDRSDAPAGVRMFHHEVFGKCQSLRACSIRLNPERIVFIGLPLWPERMLTLIPPGRWKIPCAIFIEEAHSSSSRPVFCLSGTRRERSIEGSRREEHISAALG
jgi:hypothetical protein